MNVNKNLFDEIIEQILEHQPGFNVLRLETWSPIGEILKFTLDISKDQAQAEFALKTSMFSEQNRLKPMAYAQLMAMESHLKERFIHMRQKVRDGSFDNESLNRELYSLFTRDEHSEDLVAVSGQHIRTVVQAFRSLSPWCEDNNWYEQEIGFGLPLLGHDVATLGALIDKYSFDSLINYLDWNFQWEYVNCYRVYWCRHPKMSPAEVLSIKLPEVLGYLHAYNPIYARFLLNNNGESLCLNIN